MRFDTLRCAAGTWDGGDAVTAQLTFLFTDIEASTQAWERHPDEMSLALARHDEVIQQAVKGAGGKVFKHTGDGICAVFSTATVGARRRPSRPAGNSGRRVAGHAAPGPHGPPQWGGRAPGRRLLRPGAEPHRPAARHGLRRAGRGLAGHRRADPGRAAAGGRPRRPRGAPSRRPDPAGAHLPGRPSPTSPAPSRRCGRWERTATTFPSPRAPSSAGRRSWRRWVTSCEAHGSSRSRASAAWARPGWRSRSPPVSSRRTPTASSWWSWRRWPIRPSSSSKSSAPSSSWRRPSPRKRLSTGCAPNSGPGGWCCCSTTASISSTRWPTSARRCCAVAPTSSCSTTSREPLAISGEVVWRVPDPRAPRGR